MRNKTCGMQGTGFPHHIPIHVFPIAPRTEFSYIYSVRVQLAVMAKEGGHMVYIVRVSRKRPRIISACHSTQ